MNNKSIKVEDIKSIQVEDIKSIKVEAHKDEHLLEFVKEFINTIGSPLLTPSNDEIEDKCHIN